MVNDSNKATMLYVSIKSKERNLFDGMAHTLTSKNEHGVFDILPLHTNFITLLSDYVILDKGLPTEKKFELEKGVLYIMSNKVDIHIGI